MAMGFALRHLRVRHVAVAVCLAMWPLALSDFAQGPTEYDVKAAFLLNFTKFIEWPESAFESASAPFRICIAGEDPFGDALDKMMQGESVGRHRLEVRRIRRSVTSG